MSGGFARTAEWSAAEEAGRSHITGFRKAVSATATVTSAWLDYSYFPGAPAANFYASSPLEAALVDVSRGIPVPTVAPSRQSIRNLKLMSAAASATSTTNGRQQVILADLLLYYPFVDTDAVGEEQTMTNTVALPRYTGGRVIAVAQSAASTSGQFTFTYTNQDGVAGRVSQNHFTIAVAGDVAAAMRAIGQAAAALSGSGAAAATIRATGALAAAIVVTGDALTSANVGAAVWSAPTAANDIAGTMGEKLNDAGSAGNPWATVIESGLTAEQVLRIIAAAVAGESSGAPDGPIEFTGLDGSTVRLSGDVDADGNRSNVTVDGA